MNKIQYTRKELGLEIMDNIDLRYHASDEISTAITVHETYITTETLCLKITRTGSPEPGMQAVDVNGHEVHLGISKAQ